MQRVHARRRLRAGGRSLFRIVRQLYEQADEDDVLGLASQLAFQFFLALFPFMIFLASLGGFIAALLAVDDPTARIIGAWGENLPPEAASLVRGELEQVVGNRNTGLLSFGILGSIYFASSGVRALVGAMNRAYGVVESRPLWKRFLIAFALTLVAGSTIILAFVLFVVGQVFGARIASALGLADTFAQLVALARFPISIALLIVAVSALYRLAPNVRMPLRRIAPGSLLFVAGWLALTYGFSLYVQNFASYAAVYGTLAGVVVLLMWFYFTAVLLLVGAELTEVLDEDADPTGVENERRRTQHEAHRDEPQAGAGARA